MDRKVPSKEEVLEVISTLSEKSSEPLAPLWTLEMFKNLIINVMMRQGGGYSISGLAQIAATAFWLGVQAEKREWDTEFVEPNPAEKEEMKGLDDRESDLYKWLNG